MGVESAVRSVCRAEGGVIRRPVGPKYRLQRVSLLSSCLPQLNLSSWQCKVITNLHREILYPPLALEHNAYNTT